LEILDPEPLKIIQEVQVAPDALPSSGVAEPTASSPHADASVPTASVLSKDDEKKSTVPLSTEEAWEQLEDIFSNEKYQRFSVIFIVGLLGAIALRYVLRLLIKLAKGGAERATSNARDGYAKVTEEADKFKQDLGKKAEELSLQVRLKTNAAAVEFGKQGGLKDQILSTARIYANAFHRGVVDLKREIIEINNIRAATFQGNDIAIKKSELFKSFWFQLSKKQLIILMSILLTIPIFISSVQKIFSTNEKLVAQCFGESMVLGEIASQISLGSSGSIPDKSAFYRNAANTFKEGAVSKSRELKLSPDKDDMAAYGNSLKKSLVDAMASSSNDHDAQQKYSDAFKATSSICGRVMEL